MESRPLRVGLVQPKGSAALHHQPPGVQRQTLQHAAAAGFATGRDPAKKRAQDGQDIKTEKKRAFHLAHHLALHRARRGHDR